jgi:hypothetical protein
MGAGAAFVFRFALHADKRFDTRNRSTSTADRASFIGQDAASKLREVSSAAK